MVRGRAGGAGGEATVWGVYIDYIMFRAHSCQHSTKYIRQKKLAKGIGLGEKGAELRRVKGQEATIGGSAISQIAPSLLRPAEQH